MISIFWQDSSKPFNVCALYIEAVRAVHIHAIVSGYFLSFSIPGPSTSPSACILRFHDLPPGISPSLIVQALILACASIHITSQNLYSVVIVTLMALTHKKKLLYPLLARFLATPRLCMNIHNGPRSSPDCKNMSAIL